MSCWVSSREMRPWNQGWVRWMAVGRGVSGWGGPPARGRDPRWALTPPHLTGAERGAVAGCGQAVPVRRLLLGTESEEGALGWAQGGSPSLPSTPTHPPGLCLLQGRGQHLAGVLDHPARAPREVHGHQCIVGDASLWGTRGSPEGPHRPGAARGRGHSPGAWGRSRGVGSAVPVLAGSCGRAASHTGGTAPSAGGPCCGVGEHPGTPRDLHSHPVQGWAQGHPP